LAIEVELTRQFSSVENKEVINSCRIGCAHGEGGQNGASDWWKIKTAFPWDEVFQVPATRARRGWRDVLEDVLSIFMIANCVDASKRFPGDFPSFRVSPKRDAARGDRRKHKTKRRKKEAEQKRSGKGQTARSKLSEGSGQRVRHLRPQASVGPSVPGGEHRRGFARRRARFRNNSMAPCRGAP